MSDVPPDGCVTIWIDRLKSGDRDAAGPLWQGYFARLVTLARSRLRGVSRAASDEEDVALSAFDSFCRGVDAGRFPDLDDRHDLWQVLFVMTTRKAISQVRREFREKRGSGQVIHVSATAGPEECSPDVLAFTASPEPAPEFIVEVSEECARLLSLLEDGELRSVAIWKMEGYTNAEIAGMIGRSIPTIERKLKLIRATWEGDGDEG